MRDRFRSPAVVFAVMLCCAGPAAAEARKIGDPPEALNMRLVGANDLQARSAYQADNPPTG